jgi:hypothetical protein
MLSHPVHNLHGLEVVVLQFPRLYNLYQLDQREVEFELNY